MRGGEGGAGSKWPKSMHQNNVLEMDATLDSFSLSFLEFHYAY